MSNLFKKIFGSRNDRLLKQYQVLVNNINNMEHIISELSDIELRSKTEKFRNYHASGNSIDDLLPEAFAVVREASKRVYGMRHFDVQLLGGIALHNGKIAEMRTGEGKTLTATLPVYLNAITGKGVHVVTVNDYLARRDAEWMGKLYNFLGLSVGVILSQQTSDEKKKAYLADITYGTNNEFGFDYLRDNMEYILENKRQRSLNYAIVDEVDSILIDEARTPLIISGSFEDSSDLYIKINKIPSLLVRMKNEPDQYGNEVSGDFWIDEKNQQVYLSEHGHEKVENILKEKGLLKNGVSLYDYNNVYLINHVLSALRAWNLFFRDRHYVVQEDEVIIVDEFTGRLMTGRRWSDGLHQAIEAKEGVNVQSENQTLASITFQNYFRMYSKLSGMTGTADTEAFEFQEIYNLETIVIPTNKPMIRIDENDHIYRTDAEKYEAIIVDISECYKRSQPVLVGTPNIESSEYLSKLLKKQGLKHNVLNAKNHDNEAMIVAEAGKPGSITIATNMAGRGTDIVLGGNIDRLISDILKNTKSSDAEKNKYVYEIREEWKSINELVKKSGGLRIIGTERHESRRIDNQLRGRSGRQGDPGSSCFYLSLDDQLMRIFAGDKLRYIIDHLKLPYGEAIKSGMVDRAIESAQHKVESRNFDIRKQLLEYDNISNEQRNIIYSQRNEVLESDSLIGFIDEMFKDVICNIFREYVPIDSVPDQWNIIDLQKRIESEFQSNINISNLLDNSSSNEFDLLDSLHKKLMFIYNEKRSLIKTSYTNVERLFLLQSIDYHWREHLSRLEYLRQGIHLRGYAQKNPKQEYKREAFEYFSVMLDKIRHDIVRNLMMIDVGLNNNLESDIFDKNDSNKKFNKIRRNEACPCGSSKKYKHCHGSLS
ncbi:preprotein translocase subunit SecA [Candidatus Kinetoplastidibacterium stringomonadis]|uniref:preprotein translocase subunit SecA n=1 Tax=Candidatus Kinetoplastidibacterium stringomonadis TaxID=994696 RepID=UPI0005A47BAF|nr:preprotein translocase subunit SecA [Candidatus Kinetoplastibacterium oncopeltii]